MEDFILRGMEEHGADGIDFVSICFDPAHPSIYKSYTKQEWIDSDRSYPKTNYIYWRMENGQKIYINLNTKVYTKKEVYKFDIEEILKGIKK